MRARPRRRNSDAPAGYFEDSLIQSSWARVVKARQSVAATSQFTMVRLACATAPLATVDVCIES
jgi:hypothetical protein